MIKDQNPCSEVLPTDDFKFIMTYRTFNLRGPTGVRETCFFKVKHGIYTLND